MANGKIRFGKQSGGQLALVIPDGVANTEVTFPESGVLATKQYVDDATNRIGLIDYGYAAKSYHIVAFGGEFNRVDYPKLWAYLQSNPTLVKTQAQWETEATANGGICGFFSSGNGTTTFRVPNLDKAFLRPDSRSIATFEGDAIRNISGSFQHMTYSGFSGYGAFTSLSPSINSSLSGGSSIGSSVITFESSRVVPTADENRPKNIAVLPLIVAK